MLCLANFLLIIYYISTNRVIIDEFTSCRILPLVKRKCKSIGSLTKLVFKQLFDNL